MAEVTLYENDLKTKNEQNGFITVNDPCCGSGVMFLAASKAVIKMGYNPQEVMRIYGTDIDIICCYMAFIQTNLLGLSAQIDYANTITMYVWKNFITPMAYINRYRFGDQKPKQDDNLINQKRIEIKKDLAEIRNSEETEERAENDKPIKQTEPQQLSLILFM